MKITNIRIIAILTLIINLSKLFEIKNAYDDFNYVINQINTALSTDHFFKDFKQVGDPLGKGTYGAAILMNNGKINIAVKITEEKDHIDLIPEEIAPEHLRIPDENITNIYHNIRFLKYLKQNNIPFVLETYTDRTLVTSDIDSFEYYNIWAIEYGNLGDLSKFAEKMQHVDIQFKIKALKVIVYRLVYAFKLISDLGIIHGDIKPENIFLRTCKPSDKNMDDIYEDIIKNDDEKNLCPIIGDFDFAYYNKMNSSLDIKYTPIYRPIELFRFTLSGNIVLNLRGAYQYTLKEDVFALGATIFSVLNKLKLTKTDFDKKDPFFNLITRMYSPVNKINDTLNVKDEYYNYENLAFESFDITKHFQRIKNIGPSIDFIEKILNNNKFDCSKYQKNINILNYNVIQLLKYDRVMECIENYENNGEKGEIAFMKFFEKNYKAKFIEFNSLNGDIKLNNPTAIIAKQRPEFKDVLIDMEKIVIKALNDKDIAKQEDIVNRLINGIPKQNKELSDDMLRKINLTRHHFVVTKSFQNDNLRDLKNFCSADENNYYNSLLKNNDRVFLYISRKICNGTRQDICNQIFWMNDEKTNPQKTKQYIEYLKISQSQTLKPDISTNSATEMLNQQFLSQDSSKNSSESVSPKNNINLFNKSSINSTENTSNKSSSLLDSSSNQKLAADSIKMDDEEFNKIIKIQQPIKSLTQKLNVKPFIAYIQPKHSYIMENPKKNQHMHASFIKQSEEYEKNDENKLYQSPHSNSSQDQSINSELMPLVLNDAGTKFYKEQLPKYTTVKKYII